MMKDLSWITPRLRRIGRIRSTSGWTQSLTAQRLLGPFQPDHLPHPRAQVSPLGTAHKKCYEVGVVKRRVIYNLSSGPARCHQASVNGGTYTEPSVTYDTIDDAVNVLKRFGPSAHLAKSDAEAALQTAARPPVGVPPARRELARPYVL